MIEPTHPRSVLRLVAWQGRGRLRRMGRQFLLPRRMLLSLLAFLLAAAWLGNAVITVWLRESAPPELLRAMVGLGLAFYALWHLALAACFRPQHCLEWIAAEREILEACPLRPRDLLAYQLASVTTTTLLKSMVLALLLLPDLGSVPIALAGIILGMFFLELWRMGVEISIWGMSRRGFLAFRIVVATALGGLGGGIAAIVAASPLAHGEVRVGTGLMSQIGQLLLKLDASVAGRVRLPFDPFVKMICATEPTWPTVRACGLAVGMVFLVGALVFWLFAAVPRLVARRERSAYQPGHNSASNDESGAEHIWRTGPIGWLGPTGAIAWRQWLGARRYAGSLLTALVIPGIMAMAPMFVLADPQGAFLATAGALAFYTFLLLPTALRFDFRRDLDRLALFKSLPIPSRALTAGQLATPVWISSLFQTVVLAVAALVHGQSLLLALGTVLVLVPMNVLVFALDNLIFLLYPHRMQQEGLEIFLRTMLTFTGKGLLFVLGLGLISTWGMAAALLAHALSSQLGTAPYGYAIFSAGLLLGLCLVSWGLVMALGHAYQRLNPIEDIPR